VPSGRGEEGLPNPLKHKFWNTPNKYKLLGWVQKQGQTKKMPKAGKDKEQAFGGGESKKRGSLRLHVGEESPGKFRRSKCKGGREVITLA